MRYALLMASIGMVTSMPQTEALETARVDIHERLYPDRWPAQTELVEVGVPRGACVTLQFALRAQSDGNARLSLKGNMPGKARLHWLQSVHVEGNTQGSLINRPGGKVPDGWLEHHLLREAPFDTLEVLVEDTEMPVTAGRTHGVVIEISVPRDAKPGISKGVLQVQLGNEKATAPFSYRVHATTMPDSLSLHATHWLWAQPENLTNDDIPEWWSERHWRLLEQAGKQLRRFGDNTVYTPLVNQKDPLIQITRLADGTYAFDYMRFDRWGELFLGLGFEYLSGKHIIQLPHPNYGGVYVIDEKTGKKEPLLMDSKDRNAWLDFLPTFYKSLHAHLKEKGWIKHYIQSQYDEPSDEALYRRLTALAREHMPEVLTCDAINNRANRFSPLVDIQVFSLLQLNKHQQIAAQRNAQGQGVWLYHCTSPYPPHPNRHIDSPLTESRLYPWLCYKMGASGFLFWAANGYRGADEYTSSIGPFPAPKNNQNPGHPPGDNWFFYRSPEGLRPSIRIVSHREGLIDYALVRALAKHDPDLVKKLVAQIAPSIVKFKREPTKYHQARTAILDALDNAYSTLNTHPMEGQYP